MLDYAIGKIYDVDKDGKLNASERKAANEAIREVSSFNLIFSEFMKTKKNFLERKLLNQKLHKQSNPTHGK